MSICLPSPCKPSEAVSPERTRAHLGHAYLKKHAGKWWVLATDAYIAVAVAVTAESAETKEGWIPSPVLKLMEQNAKHLSFEQMSATAWNVIDRKAGTHTTIDVPALGTEKNFPDFKKLGVWDDPPNPKQYSPFGVNLDLASRAGKALGGPVRVELEGPLKPIRLRSVHGGGHRALLMPVRLMDVAEAVAA